MASGIEQHAQDGLLALTIRNTTRSRAMKTLRACAVTAVVATSLSLVASVALFSEDNTARETRDRNEIEALMWKYTRALDKGDGATYASTYTEDGQFGTGANATKGREALTKLV